MSVLLMRLEGPMQSWGTYSRFTERDSGKEPSKSGVIGILCAALGRSREESLHDLARMGMAVRVDREGRLSRDYHTALEVPRAGNPGTSTVVSNRYFLSDACFLVAMHGEAELVQELKEALANPKWEMFLGRKSYAPSAPVLLSGGDLYPDCNEAIRSHPWLGRPTDQFPAQLRAVVETTPEEGEARMDVPVSFAKREFTSRFIKIEWIPTAGLEKEA
jgi:CRISPR system Cascade subunit CasD